MSKLKNQNEKKWKEIFLKLPIMNAIDRQGFFEISAEEIKKYREPRLMTKFDNYASLPEIFKRAGLSILPVSRGNYIISRAKIYHQFEDKEDENEENERIFQFSLPDYIHSIDVESITSESVAVNAAMISGIIADFMGETDPQLTLSGRMGSESFDFYAELKEGSQRKFEIRNSQIEIDAAYEGFESLMILEAKNYIAKDFIIRQLYYPYRLWQAKMEKSVRPVFLTYSNGIFTLREYEFSDIYLLNSIKLVKKRRYSLETTEIEMNEIEKILQETQIEKELEDVPFPQANSFDRVVDLCEKLKQKNMDREEIVQEYGFDKRQVGYYVNAGRYLGLLEKENFTVTEKFNRISRMKYKNRQLTYCKMILSHKVFNEVMRETINRSVIPPKEMIFEKIRMAGIKIDRSTIQRRASTVRAWIEWILKLPHCSSDNVYNG